MVHHRVLTQTIGEIKQTRHEFCAQYTGSSHDPRGVGFRSIDTVSFFYDIFTL